jgi:hypothetical protein
MAERRRHLEEEIAAMQLILESHATQHAQHETNYQSLAREVRHNTEVTMGVSRRVERVVEILDTAEAFLRFLGAFGRCMNRTAARIARFAKPIGIIASSIAAILLLWHQITQKGLREGAAHILQTLKDLL